MRSEALLMAFTVFQVRERLEFGNAARMEIKFSKA